MSFVLNLPKDLPKDLPLDRGPQIGGFHVHRADLDPAPPGLGDDYVGRVEAHRLVAQERGEERRWVVTPQPGGLVGQHGEGRERSAERRRWMGKADWQGGAQGNCTLRSFVLN